MPLTVWVIALTLLTVCIWHARHDAQHGVQEWHTVLPLSCMAGVVVSSCLGLVAYKSFYSHYWLYRSSHSYVNVLPSEPAAGYLDAGKLVFADEARVDAKRGLGFKDRSVYCVAPIIDDSKPEKIQFWAAGQDCCSARGDFECDDAWDRKAHAGVVVRRAAPEYLQAVKQAKAVYGLSSPAEPIFVQWVVDPEKVELNYWLLGNGVLIGSCLVFLVLSGVVNVILLPLTKPPEEVRQPMVRPPRQADREANLKGFCHRTWHFKRLRCENAALKRSEVERRRAALAKAERELLEQASRCQPMGGFAHAMLRAAGLASLLSVCSASSSDAVLWGGATDIATCVLASPFIRSMCDGTLDARHFAQYMIQDMSCYMPGATEVLLSLYQRSLKEHGPRSNWTMFFKETHENYRVYGEAEAEGWNLEKVGPSKACTAYVEFLRQTAESESLAQAVIAFAPCSVLWDWLAVRMRRCAVLGNAYTDWIKALPATKKQADFNAWDPLLQEALQRDRAQSLQTFRKAMIQELEFFNSVVPGFKPATSFHCSVPPELAKGGVRDEERKGDTFLTCLGLGAIAISVLQWCFCHKPPPPMEKPLL
ncbi:unnamed protein product [Symbiodinium sp. KB8]|nr:unnamed protein product [Symbiodinium sp. KB8]